MAGFAVINSDAGTARQSPRARSLISQKKNSPPRRFAQHVDQKGLFSSAVIVAIAGTAENGFICSSVLGRGICSFVTLAAWQLTRPRLS
jgi:hypothetical protein